MPIFKIIVFCLLLTATKSFATDACSELSSFTCQAGTYDDGTGSTTLPLDVANKKLSLAYDKAMMPVFTRALENSNQAKFREDIIGALGPDLNSCRSSDTTQRRTCNQTLARRLTDFLTLDTLVGDYIDRVDYMKMYDLTSSAEFRALAEEGIKEVGKSYSIDEKIQNIKSSVIPNIVASFESKISEMPIDIELKKKMLGKIKSVEFAGSDCGELNENYYDPSTIVDELYYPLGYYSSWDNTLKVCKGLLTEGYSEFTLAHTIARELAHTIDLCSFARETSATKVETLNNSYPLKDLAACLRSPQAANAIVTSAGQSLPAIETACEQDQSSEALANWFATEITVDYISQKHPRLNNLQWQKGMANISRGSCTDSEDGGEKYGNQMEAAKRINRIFAADPKVRSKMGCSNSTPVARYCDGQSPSPMSAPLSRARSTPENVRPTGGHR